MNIKFISYAMMALAMGFTFSACGDDDDNEKKPDEGIVIPDDSNNTSDQVLTSKEQKEVLEQTARNLLDKIKSSDFQALTDIAKYYRDEMDYKRKYDYNIGKYVYYGINDDAIKEWFEDALKLCEGSMSNNVQKNLYVAANFKARFVAGSERWELAGQSDGLEFQFNDKNGKQCILKITASDNYTKAHLTPLDNTDWEWNGSTEVQKRYENTFGVPETVNVTFTQGGNQLVNATVKTKLTMNKEDVDLSTDDYEATVDANVCGYNIIVEKAEFLHDQKAYVSTTIKKNNETLIKLQAEANGKVRLTTESENYYGRYREWTEFNVREAGRGIFKVDVLGKVQAVGEIKDIDMERNFIEKAHKSRYDESAFKEAIENANNQLNIGLYYDGKNTRMATVLWSTTAYRKYSDIYYEATPAIKFDDGTSYTFEEYFDKTYFKKVVDNFNNLMNDFEDILD